MSLLFEYIFFFIFLFFLSTLYFIFWRVDKSLFVLKLSPHSVIAYLTCTDKNRWTRDSIESVKEFEWVTDVYKWVIVDSLSCYSHYIVHFFWFRFCVCIFPLRMHYKEYIDFSIRIEWSKRHKILLFLLLLEWACDCHLYDDDWMNLTTVIPSTIDCTYLWLIQLILHQTSGFNLIRCVRIEGTENVRCCRRNVIKWIRCVRARHYGRVRVFLSVR